MPRCTAIARRLRAPITRASGAAPSVLAALALVTVALTGVDPRAGANDAQAAVPPALEQGGMVRRSTADGTLTAEDRRRFRELGLARPQSAAVVIRKMARSEGPRQLARLQALTHAPEGFAPSGACDEIVPQGEAHALCTGHASGPFGNVAVRMPVAVRLVQSADGGLHLALHNPKALEAKGVFSWSTVVAAEHLQVAYDLLPDGDGWLVYVRVGVEMSAHEDSAKEISDAMLRLEAWLTRQLAQT
jgi:hypothetical protein